MKPIKNFKNFIKNLSESSGKMYYRYNCVSPDNEDELNFIIDNTGNELSYKQFLKYVDNRNFKDMESQFPLPFSKEPFVSFWESKLPDGTPCVYFQHSATEYIFY